MTSHVVGRGRRRGTADLLVLLLLFLPFAHSRDPEQAAARRGLTSLRSKITCTRAYTTLCRGVHERKSRHSRSRRPRQTTSPSPLLPPPQPASDELSGHSHADGFPFLRVFAQQSSHLSAGSILLLLHGTERAERVCWGSSDMKRELPPTPRAKDVAAASRCHLAPSPPRRIRPYATSSRSPSRPEQLPTLEN